MYAALSLAALQPWGAASFHGAGEGQLCAAGGGRIAASLPAGASPGCMPAARSAPTSSASCCCEP